MPNRQTKADRRWRGHWSCEKDRTTDAIVQIVIHTVFDDNTHVFEAMYAGANGYLLKKYVSDKLIQSIREVLDGGCPDEPFHCPDGDLQ